MDYRESGKQQTIEQGWESKLKALVDRLVQYGESGEDIANYTNAKREANVVRTKRFMHESVLKLGCDLQKRFGNISHKEWAHWMQCSSVEVTPERVVVKHYSPFFVSECDKRYTKTLEKFYDLPVIWEYSETLEAYVKQWR